MKRVVLRSVVSVLVALVMLLSLCSCDFFHFISIMDRLTPDTYHANVDFETLAYEKPDMEAANGTIDTLMGLLEQKAPLREVLDAYVLVVEAYERLSLMNSLLQIRCDRDLEDLEAAEEMIWLTEESALFSSALADMNYALMLSEHSETFFGELTEEEKEQIRVNAELMDEEYVLLQTQITEYTMAYDALSTEALSVGGGKTATAAEIQSGAYTEGEKGAYYASYNERAGEIYLELLPLYKRIAEKLGYDSAAAYYYEAWERDYDEQQVASLYAFAKGELSVLYDELYSSLTASEKSALELPYSSGDHLQLAQTAIGSYFDELESRLETKTIYGYMQRYHLADIGGGGNRVSSSYTTYLSSVYMPYMFITTMGNYSDIDTLVHEFGHFTSFYHNGNNTLLDVSEIQSQGNEYLFLPYYEQIYGKTAGSAIRKLQWLEALDAITMGCLMDEFQRLSFEGEYRTVEQLNELFYSLALSYGLSEDGFITDLAHLWSLIPHNFHYPFYYISYATSLLPALEIGAIAENDRESALDAYATVILLGDGTLGFLDLLDAAGLYSPFSREGQDLVRDGVHSVIGKATDD